MRASFPLEVRTMVGLFPVLVLAAVALQATVQYGIITGSLGIHSVAAVVVTLLLGAVHFLGGFIAFGSMLESAFNGGSSKKSFPAYFVQTGLAVALVTGLLSLLVVGIAMIPAFGLGVGLSAGAFVSALGTSIAVGTLIDVGVMVVYALLGTIAR